LVRALPCHGRGRGFESRQSRSSTVNKDAYHKRLLFLVIWRFMTKEVVITGIGLQSALGNLEQSWSRLLNAETGIQVQQVFPQLPALPVAMIAMAPQQLNVLMNQLVAAVLSDAGWTASLPECAVVIGSSRAYQPIWEQFNQSGADFPVLDYLPQMLAITAARQIGSQAAILAPMAACSTGIWSIERGYQLIASGQYQQALVGAVEAPLSPLTIIGFQRLGVLAGQGCYPFDRQRQGLVLGEGGAIFALEERRSAERRGAKIYGRLRGFGLTNDAYHACTIDPSGTSAVTAIQKCLQVSQLQTTDIDYIHVHGTATQLNDQHEAALLHKLWPQSVPISGTKGAIGHTLGASAALGVAFACQALYDQLLPPSVGCRESAFALDIIQTARPSQLQHILCWSFGFGGQNAVLAISSV
jgi:3-oxoacyl-[acyl-carrier-protein] synthase II